MTTGLEIGHYLARLRDKSGIQQNELAEKLPFSATVLSRIESGGRAASRGELSSILDAIGTEEARQLSETIDRDWLNLPRPPLGHPEESFLWNAELACQDLTALKEDPQIPYPFVRRLDESLGHIRTIAEMALEDEYSIALVGEIGAGKTTALCRIAGLESTDKITGQSTTVLDVGAGGTTLCEVQVARGPGYGIFVEPRTDAELYREIREFARSFMPDPESVQPEEEVEPGFAGTAPEIARAIRNMSGLTIKRPRREDGTRDRIDSIRELADQATDADELAVAIQDRMNLQKRIRRELWYPEMAREEPFSWLAGVFRQVNNGRHAEFSLPKRIEVIVPQRILTGETDAPFSIRLVDTRGIYINSERGDLETYFSNPSALVILCSTFNDAPSTSLQQLLDKAVKGGFPNIENKCAVLVLPRPAEALAVKDDDGDPVDCVADGYELKGEKATAILRDASLPDVKVEFFNSFEDDPQRAVSFLLDMVNDLRHTNVGDLQEVTERAKALVQNHTNEQVRAVERQASAQLKTWLNENQQITPFAKRPEDSLLEAMGIIRYVSSLRASINREGIWENFDYAYLLGSGTRAMALRAVNPKVRDFQSQADILLKTPGLEAAQNLVTQAVSIINTGTRTFSEECRLLGRAIYANHIEGASALWQDCGGEWGKGQGYRDRVHKHHVEWFADNRSKIDSYANPVIEAKWQALLARVSDILQTD